MASWLPALVYGHESARFESDFSLVESVERLRAATTRSAIFSLHKQSASGTVNARRVSLRRVIPLVGNSYKPVFVGTFELVNGRVVLVGRFTLSSFVRTCITLWFSVNLLLIPLATVSLVAHPESGPWWFPLLGLGMAAVGVAVVKVGKWFARNDVAWLSALIQATLSAKVPPDQSFKPTGHKTAWPAA